MKKILGVTVSSGSYEDLTTKSLAWAVLGQSRGVFFANVHMVMEAFDDPSFRADLNAADLVNPDGMPLVWALRAMGEEGTTRVYGPDATEIMLSAAQNSNIPIGFYGGSEHTLETLVAKVRRKYPKLAIVFNMSPPFRHLDRNESEEIASQIVSSGARMLFVGLGCPKQERWIIDHLGRIPAVMFGVGAAFDFLAGTKSQAPRWIMRIGLEWLFRLVSEPRRLTKRYLKHNPRFVALVLQQLMCRHQ